MEYDRLTTLGEKDWDRILGYYRGVGCMQWVLLRTQQCEGAKSTRDNSIQARTPAVSCSTEDKPPEIWSISHVMDVSPRAA